MKCVVGMNAPSSKELEQRISLQAPELHYLCCLLFPLQSNFIFDLSIYYFRMITASEHI